MDEEKKIEEETNEEEMDMEYEDIEDLVLQMPLEDLITLRDKVSEKISELEWEPVGWPAMDAQAMARSFM